MCQKETEPIDAAQPPAEDASRTPEDIQILAEKAAQYDELHDRLLRVQADYENSCKRMQRTMQEEIDHGIEGLAADLLPVCDNLTRAIRAAAEHDAVEKIREGVEMVEKQLYDALARHGVTPIETEPGQPFDPNQHEAMSVISAPGHAPNTIIEEMQRGFRIHKRLLRPARVVVGAPEPEENTSET